MNSFALILTGSVTINSRLEIHNNYTSKRSKQNSYGTQDTYPVMTVCEGFSGLSTLLNPSCLYPLTFMDPDTRQPPDDPLVLFIASHAFFTLPLIPIQSLLVQATHIYCKHSTTVTLQTYRRDEQRRKTRSNTRPLR